MELALTIEDRIRNQSTRIDGLAIQLSQRLTIPIIQSRRRDVIALQLPRVVALHVSSMVLIKVGQLVIQEDRRMHVRRNVELNSALVLTGRSCVGEIGKLPIWR